MQLLPIKRATLVDKPCGRGAQGDHLGPASSGPALTDGSKNGRSIRREPATVEGGPGRAAGGPRGSSRRRAGGVPLCATRRRATWRMLLAINYCWRCPAPARPRTSSTKPAKRSRWWRPSWPRSELRRTRWPPSTACSPPWSTVPKTRPPTPPQTTAFTGVREAKATLNPLLPTPSLPGLHPSS